MCVCFVQLLFFDIVLLRSMGIGAAITIGATLLVNLTLLPALVLTFPRFCRASLLPWRQMCSWRACLGLSSDSAMLDRHTLLHGNDDDDDDDLLLVSEGGEQ